MKDNIKNTQKPKGIKHDAKKLIGSILITFAAILQAFLLLFVFQPTQVSYVFIALIFLAVSHIWVNFTSHLHMIGINSTIVVITVGGLGMIIGSMIDLTLSGFENLLAFNQLSIDMTHAHHHEPAGMINYMMSVMLLFCVPFCLFYCSTESSHKSRKLEFCRHIMSTLFMVLFMLYLPNTLAASFVHFLTLWEINSNFVASLSTFSGHHVLMTVCMGLGAYFGYFLFNSLARIYLALFNRNHSPIKHLLSHT